MIWCVELGYTANTFYLIRYGVPAVARQRFETAAQAAFPEEWVACREFLRHKTVLLSPAKLALNGIPVVTGVQRAGEFVVTFPGT